MSNAPLNGKTALITGAGQGIGLAVAHALASAGCDVILAGRNLVKLEKAGRELARHRTRVSFVACDVRDPHSVRQAFLGIGHLDILVNNAGVAHVSANVDTLSLEAWKETIETNLTGMFLVTQAALPLMKRGGTIVNNLSVAAKQVFGGLSAYNASKHGALGFTKTLREELRPKGIRVIALIVGATDTEIWNAFWKDAPREKMMSPETVAQAVLSAVLLPDNATVEEITLRPSAGTL